jgi:hypothetical protein
VRIAGCECCRSAFNAQTAAHYAAQTEAALAAAFFGASPWAQIVDTILATRTRTHDECRPVEARMIEALPILQPHIRCSNAHFDPASSQDDLELFREWFQRVVYAECVIVRHNEPRLACEIAATLAAYGHASLAQDFLCLVPGPPPCCHLLGAEEEEEANRQAAKAPCCPS